VKLSTPSSDDRGLESWTLEKVTAWHWCGSRAERAPLSLETPQQPSRIRGTSTEPAMPTLLDHSDEVYLESRHVISPVEPRGEATEQG